MMSIVWALVGGIAGWFAGAGLLVWASGDGGSLSLWWLVLAEVCVALGAGVPGGFAMKSGGGRIEDATGARIGIAFVGGTLTVLIAYFAHVNMAALEAAAASGSAAWLDHLSLGALPELHLRGRWNMDFSIGWTAAAAGLLGTYGTYKMTDLDS